MKKAFLSTALLIGVAAAAYAAGCEPDVYNTYVTAERKPLSWGVGNKTTILKTDNPFIESVNTDISRDVRNSETLALVYVNSDLTKVFKFLDLRKNKGE